MVLRMDDNFETHPENVSTKGILSNTILNAYKEVNQYFVNLFFNLLKLF